jgi:tRNA threonylcarbamoyl adenosine modification protein YeaZ/ribosomal-protein-alanine acetyltransferase
MVILALETATRRGSLALFADGAITADAGGDARRTHGERLPGEITTFLAGLGRSLRDVDCFAVVSGPGSFTGLRVGMASVQGLALAARKPVIAVPTLEALASGWIAQSPGESSVVAACLDGQRGDVFLAAYAAHDAGAFDSLPIVIAPTVARPDEAARDLAALDPARPLVIVGDGAGRHAALWSAAVPRARLVDPPEPIAAAAVRLAARRLDQAVSPHALRPIYLRRPDAEIARAHATPAPALSIEVAGGADDLSAVEALQRRSFTNAWGAESIRWELENTDVARLYLARDVSGTLVAYCACWMIFDELHINSLAVEVDRRRQGVARALLRRVMRDAAASGARSATLEVRQSNQAARGLYEGLGFKVEAVRRDYYQEPREDALVLWHRQIAALAPPANPSD